MLIPEQEESDVEKLQMTHLTMLVVTLVASDGDVAQR